MKVIRNPCASSLLALSMCLSWFPAQADYTTYQAPLDSSSWRVEAKTGECELVHDVPRFGKARFRQVSGGQLEFLLDADQGPVSEGELMVRSVAPAWKRGQEPQELGRHAFARGQSPVRFGRELALRLYYELENGMFPVFESRDWADGRDALTVTLSAVRFGQVTLDFQTCVAGLIHFDFDVESERRVYFATDSDVLTLQAKRDLEEVIKSIKIGAMAPRIVIGGHADERGGAGHNEQLSLRRAKSVSSYLVKRGIPRKSIEVRYFGANWPLNSASTPSAWAQNRRASVWVAR
jgi:outer membrane protein OmpA-like peptidoglycan-associated protein